MKKNIFKKVVSTSLLGITALGNIVGILPTLVNALTPKESGVTTVTLDVAENGKMYFEDTDATSKEYTEGQMVRVRVKADEGYVHNGSPVIEDVLFSDKMVDTREKEMEDGSIRISFRATKNNIRVESYFRLKTDENEDSNLEISDDVFNSLIDSGSIVDANGLRVTGVTGFRASSTITTQSTGYRFSSRSTYTANSGKVRYIHEAGVSVHALYKDGQLVYCIEPGVEVGSVPYTVNNNAISGELRSKIAKAIYYLRNKYSNNTNKRLAMTILTVQTLAHPNFDGGVKVFGNEFNDVRNEVNNFINNFYTKPSFNGQTFSGNGEIRIVDTNGVLSGHTIVGNPAGVRIEGNTLVVTGDFTGNSIQLRKHNGVGSENDTELPPIVYTNGSYQNLVSSNIGVEKVISTVNVGMRIKVRKRFTNHLIDTTFEDNKRITVALVLRDNADNVGERTVYYKDLEVGEDGTGEITFENIPYVPSGYSLFEFKRTFNFDQNIPYKFKDMGGGSVENAREYFNNNGYSNLGYVTEITANTNSDYNSNFILGEGTSDKSLWIDNFKLTDEVVVEFTNKQDDKERLAKGNIILTKVSSLPNKTDGNLNYSLSGVQFKAVNQETNEEFVQSTDNDGKVEWKDLVAGTYNIYEISTPKGYETVGTKLVATANWEDSSNIFVVKRVDSVKTTVIQNTPKLGSITIEKQDKELMVKEAQGDATLWATFEIINNDDFAKEGFAKGEVMQTVTTDYNTMTAVVNDAPLGKYIVREVSTYDSYWIGGSSTDDDVYEKEVEITEDNLNVELAVDNSFRNEVKRGGLRVFKADKETNDSDSVGGKNHDGENGKYPHLNGVTFSIFNESLHNVLVNGKVYAPNEKVLDIQTKWDETLGKYVAQTDNDTLPYGTYRVQETGTNDTYVLDNASSRTVQIRENGVIVEVGTFYNQVKRYHLDLTKLVDLTDEKLSTAFSVTNVATGETHVIVTDENGKFVSSDRDNTVNTNINDHALTTDGLIDTTTLEANSGLWFGKTSNGNYVEPKSWLGSLPYGEYVIQELATISNSGLDLKRVEFITGGTLQVGRSVVIPDIVNSRLDITVGTVAIDSRTNDHIMFADKNQSFTDTVSYTNLRIGKTYRLKAKLMNASNGALIVVNGKEVSATKDFVPNAVNGSVDVVFSGVDLSNFAGTTTVVFEELYELWGEGNSNELLVAQHKDLKDKGQTIEVPEIKTSAIVEDNGTKMLSHSKVQTIVDTVTYTNLLVGKTYVAKGKLMDKDTNSELLVDGQPILAEKTFTATTSNGSVDLEFTIDSSKLDLEKVNKIVVFEDLYFNGVKIATHSDINDLEQTINVPKVKTSAVSQSTKTKTVPALGKQVVVDTVTYSNLIVGKTYVVNGKLMDKSTNAPLLVNGEEVTATLTFVADSENGSVDLEFVIEDTSLLQGKTIVVFEDLLHDGHTLAVHHDINDVKQTVYVPKVDTEATTVSGGKDGHINEKHTEVAVMTGLTEGETYTVVATQYDSTGKAFSSQEREIIAKGLEHIEIFEFDVPKDYIGDIVYGEDVFYNGEKIAVHYDLTNKKQTVTVKEPKIQTEASDSQDGDNIVDGRQQEAKIIDKVILTDLVIGKEYEIEGFLVVKKDGEEIEKAVDKDGNVVTIKKTFIAQDVNETHELEFVIDATKYANKHLVAFESLSNEGVTLAVHHDINDVKQTVYVTYTLEITIVKVDADNQGYFLKGAEFTVFNADGTVAKDVDGNEAIGLTDENGKVTFNIAYDVNNPLYVMETKAPAGYEKTDEKFEVKVKEDGTLGLEQIEIKALNKAIIIPPKTGVSENANLFIISGASALLGLVAFGKRRKENK